MDHNAFDTFTRALTEAGPRRGLLGLLATLPVLGGFVALLGFDEADSKGRRKRRKKRHKHGKGRDKGKKKRKKCNPNSTAKTCAGKCGPVKNNCQKTVDCGSCACDPPCAVCFTCEEGPNTHGVCVPDPDQEGDACGEPGQVCQRDGSCACSSDSASCPACTTCGADGACQGCTECCDGGTCVADCGDCQVCADGQCVSCPDCCDAEGVCQPGDTDAACGSGGACDVCTGQEECQDQSCVCVPVCDGRVCGSDGCDGQCGPGCAACESCLGDGACTAPCNGSGCCAGTTCELGASNTACGRNGEPCVSCTGAGVTCGGGGTPGVCGCTPDCTGEPCSDDGCGGMCRTCGSGELCLAGACAPGRYVFVSSSWVNANLGGLNGADDRCTTLAGAAGLPGAYKAWLSDDTGSPATRFTRSTVPYVRVDGTVVANNWAGLTSGTLLQAINRTETGGFFNSGVWTSTKPDGTLTDGRFDCDNWSNGTGGADGGMGDSNVTHGNWTGMPGRISCNANTEAIYCFQQG